MQLIHQTLISIYSRIYHLYSWEQEYEIIFFVYPVKRLWEIYIQAVKSATKFRYIFLGYQLKRKDVVNGRLTATESTLCIINGTLFLAPIIQSGSQHQRKKITYYIYQRCLLKQILQQSHLGLDYSQFLIVLCHPNLSFCKRIVKACRWFGWPIVQIRVANLILHINWKQIFEVVIPRSVLCMQVSCVYTYICMC